MDPFDKIDGTWLGVVGFVAVFGAAILLVSFGAYLTEKAGEVRAKRKAAKERADQWRQMNDEALRNVEILSHLEQRALAWILRNGQQRFQAPYFVLEGNLISKGIVFGPLGATSDVYAVIDGVWQKRDELLKRYAGIAAAMVGSLG